MIFNNNRFNLILQTGKHCLKTFPWSITLNIKAVKVLFFVVVFFGVFFVNHLYS